MPSHEVSLRNLQKARAAWSHPARPWRSFQESRLIERLAWQWFNAGDARQWSERAVARWLGVSHTYVQKLVRKFRAEPEKMRSTQAAFGPATFEQLNSGREFTRQAKERGYLRSPKRWKLATFQVGSNTVRAIVLTKAEERRRAAEAQGRPLGPAYVPFSELPLWARGICREFTGTPWDSAAMLQRAMRQVQRPRPVRFGRRWRPGRPR
ncbi:MAG TPA: hypothetical protein VMV59_00660 [Candidatus Dormibacteraeota bacterium]|nr:hypothetical protein [Candidatus Dormibacteraeota bacterium]